MEKNMYHALAGVPFVNGEPVPADRKLMLTETEAAYDLAHGRIRKGKVTSEEKATE